MRIKSKLVKERNDLLPIDYLFSGFKSTHLAKYEYNDFNGVRITMRPPAHPVKLGIIFIVSFREAEKFSVIYFSLNSF